MTKVIIALAATSTKEADAIADIILYLTNTNKMLGGMKEFAGHVKKTKALIATLQACNGKATPKVREALKPTLASMESGKVRLADVSKWKSALKL